jgi:hypothetical protein
VVARDDDVIPYPDQFSEPISTRCDLLRRWTRLANEVFDIHEVEAPPLR